MKTEVTYQARASVNSQYVSKEYVLQGYDSLDASFKKTAHINLRPQGKVDTFSAKVTFGMRIEIPIPNVIDSEGDVIGKSFKNTKNPQLALYESIKFDETA